MSEIPQSPRWPRRRFLRTSTTLAAAALLPRSSWASAPRAQPLGHESLCRSIDPHFVLDDPAWQTFTQRGLDAARQAGAQYADVRLTRTLTQQQSNSAGVADQELLGVGVRALVNGCWGFASSPYWQHDEPVMLGRMAAQQAGTVARVTPGTVNLSARPVASGSWIMPVAIDPFTLPIEEKRDFIASWFALTAAYQSSNGSSMQMSAGWTMTFVRQEQALATSDGSYVTQVVYRSDLYAPFGVGFPDNRILGKTIQRVDEAGVGWEYLLEAKVPDQVLTLVEEAAELWRAPRKPAEPGRVTVVFDAATTARLVDKSVGLATELDRALGDEANASGTSFLGPDLAAMLGKPIGASSVTMTGDRRMARGLATVKWDAEGVEPDMFTMVDKGILHDYQTTRPLAAPMANWYAQRGLLPRSHGCATAASALDATMQTPPNLTLAPGAREASFAELVASVSSGLAVFDAEVTTDFQAKHGLVKGGIVREIKNGKIGAWIQNPGFIFESTELWKNVITLGGAASAAQFPVWREKGEPAQRVPYTVRAVPMLVKNVAVIDVTRR